MSAVLSLVPTVSATEFLTRLYAPVDEGHLNLFAIDRTSGQRASRWGTVNDIPALIISATPLLDTSCIWFGVATRTRNLGSQRGGADDCAAITAVWADIDIAGPNHAAPNLPTTRADAIALLEDFPLPPTAIVDTGGGIQPWWFLTDTLDHDQALGFLARWGATWNELGRRRGWLVDNVFDLARIMRLPATFNRKNTPVRVTVADWQPDRRYTVDELDQYTLEPPAPPADMRPQRAVPYIGPQRPGDAFNVTADPADILVTHGFVFDKDTHGDRAYRAPHHADERGSTGATVYADGHTTIWSETFAAQHRLTVRRPYDAFGLYAMLEHSGDWTAATTKLVEFGYGSPGAPALTVLEVLTPTATDTAGTRLDDSFWEARPILTHIRQAARSRLVSPSAVLGAVLARVAAYTPPSSCLPALVGSTAPLSLYVALRGSSGAGKSSPAATAADLLPGRPAGCVGPLSLGSGEGLVEAFMDLVEEDDGNGKKRKVKRQVFHGALFSLDEGQALAEIGSRKGSTILPVLRTAWSGGDPGQANASIETRRSLRPGSYNVGLVSLWQDHAAAMLLEDVDGGTPQRFVWFQTDDPEAGDHGIPDWPGEIEWRPPAYIGSNGVVGRHVIDVHPDIAFQIKRARLADLRGDTATDPLDAHRRLNQLKLAGVFAVLDHRHDIDLDDWALAELVMANSDAVRNSVIAAARAIQRQAVVATLERAVERDAVVENAAHQRALASAAKSVANRVWKADEPVTLNYCRNAIAGKHRAVLSLDDVLSEAMQREWVAAFGDSWTKGKRRP